MHRSLLLLFLLSAPLAAQDGIAPTTTTDQTEYSYGEVIEVRYTLANDGTEPFTVWGSSSGCQAYLQFDDFDSALSYGPPCTTDSFPFEFAPGESATWVWLLDPAKIGLPRTDGLHTVTGYFRDDDSDGNGSLTVATEASTTITAPLYVGGRLLVTLETGVLLDEVEDVMDALSATLVAEDPESPFPEGDLWEITGATLEQAVATYGDDKRFRTFEAYRFLAYDEVIFSTETENPPGAGDLALTAAHPNPFAISTTLALTVPEAGSARVEVFDVLGRRVATLYDGPLTPDVEHRFTLSADGLPSGLYIVRARGDGYSQTRRVTLSR